MMEEWSNLCIRRTAADLHALPAVQVERLQRKFATIHSTLAQQQNVKPGPDTPRMSSLAQLNAENTSKVCCPFFVVILRLSDHCQS